MNTREDDGPAANDNDDDDEMWGNVKNISFDLTNEEINVIKDTNFKFLFAGKVPRIYTPRECTAGYLWRSASQYAFTPEIWSKFS
jgi:hypothetical protein